MAHPKTRLCKLTDDGKYKIVRKTCQRCGSAALSTSITRVPTNVHGYKKKEVKHRELNVQGLLTAGGSHGSDAHTNVQSQSHKHHSNGHHGPGSKSRRGIGRSHSSKEPSANDAKPQLARSIDRSNSERQTTKMLRQSSQGTKASTSSDGSNVCTSNRGRAFAVIDPQKPSRRSRTMSPARRIDGTRRGRTLSPVRQKLANAKTASSGYFRKVSEELAAHSPRHVKQIFHTKLRSPKVLPIHGKTNRHPFDCRGYCSLHPDVQLAKKDRGSWTVIQDFCPRCNESNKPPRSRSSTCTNRNAGKVCRAIKQLKSSDKTNGPTDSPKYSNEMAVVVVDSAKARSNRPRDTVVSAGEIVLHETALLPVEEPSIIQRKEEVSKNTYSNASPTSVNSPSNNSHPSPAFSSNYFTGTEGFPSLPLIADDLNISHATIKHSNAMVASKKRKPRSAELSG